MYANPPPALLDRLRPILRRVLAEPPPAPTGRTFSGDDETDTFSAYDESKHPRDDHGHFVKTSAIQASAHYPEVAAAVRSRVTNPAERAKLDALIAHHEEPIKARQGERDAKRTAHAAKQAEREKRQAAKAEGKGVLRREFEGKAEASLAAAPAPAAKVLREALPEYLKLATVKTADEAETVVRNLGKSVGKAWKEAGKASGQSAASAASQALAAAGIKGQVAGEIAKGIRSKIDGYFAQTNTAKGDLDGVEVESRRETMGQVHAALFSMADELRKEMDGDADVIQSDVAYELEQAGWPPDIEDDDEAEEKRNEVGAAVEKAVRDSLGAHGGMGQTFAEEHIPDPPSAAAGYPALAFYAACLQAQADGDTDTLDKLQGLADDPDGLAELVGDLESGHHGYAGSGAVKSFSAGVKTFAWAHDPSPRSASRITNDSGSHAYGETARRIMEAQGRATRGEPEPEHPARVKAQDLAKSREPGRQQAREALAAALDNPHKLDQFQLFALHDHVKNLTRDEARQKLKDLGAKAGGRLKADIVRGIIDHVKERGRDRRTSDDLAKVNDAVNKRIETVSDDTWDGVVPATDAGDKEFLKGRGWKPNQFAGLTANGEPIKAGEGWLQPTRYGKNRVVTDAEAKAELEEWHPKRNEPKPAKPAAQPVAAHAPAPTAAKEPPKDGVPADPKAGQVYNVGVHDLNVDPSRFQFKLNTSNPAGVTDELKGVRTWNPDFAGTLAVWKDPADGKTYVVNGHHRHELAARLGAKDLAVRYLDAKDAKEARAKGALINIAEGRGTAIDAAKFMRDSGVGIEDFAKHGVPLKQGQLADQAVALTGLNDKAFDRLAKGDLDMGKALAVAKHLPDHDRQEKLFKLLGKREDEGKDLSNRTVEELARQMASSPSYKKTEDTLWGPETTDEDTFVQRAELAGHVRGELAKEMGDFEALASKRRAEKTAGAGNILNVEKNKELAREAEQGKNLYDMHANLKGPVSAALNDAALKLAQAKTKKERENVRAETVDAVRTALKSIADGKPGQPAAETDRGGEGQPVQGDQGSSGRQPDAGDPGRGSPEPGGLTPEAAAKGGSPSAAPPKPKKEPALTPFEQEKHAHFIQALPDFYQHMSREESGEFGHRIAAIKDDPDREAKYKQILADAAAKVQPRRTAKVEAAASAKADAARKAEAYARSPEGQAAAKAKEVARLESQLESLAGSRDGEASADRHFIGEKLKRLKGEGGAAA